MPAAFGAARGEVLAATLAEGVAWLVDCELPSAGVALAEWAFQLRLYEHKEPVFVRIATVEAAIPHTPELAANVEGQPRPCVPNPSDFTVRSAWRVELQCWKRVLIDGQAQLRTVLIKSGIHYSQSYHLQFGDPQPVKLTGNFGSDAAIAGRTGRADLTLRSGGTRSALRSSDTALAGRTGRADLTLRSGGTRSALCSSDTTLARRTSGPRFTLRPRRANISLGPGGALFAGRACGAGFSLRALRPGGTGDDFHPFLDEVYHLLFGQALRAAEEQNCH